MNPKPNSRTLAAIAGAVSLCIGAAAASPTGYYLVGHPSDAPAGSISSVGGLSYSGVAVGNVDNNEYRTSFIFSGDTGRFDLPRPIPNERPFVTGVAISGDASIVVGSVNSSATNFLSKAMRYTPGGTIELLPAIGTTPTRSQAWGASHNASTIVGSSGGGPAFWRGDTGYQLPEIRGLNSGGLAYDVDSAGTTAVGVSAWGFASDLQPGAVKWSLETRTLTRLSRMSDDPNERSSGYSISGDGRIIVGNAAPMDALYQAVLWDETGAAQRLGNVTGSFSSEARGVSHDGSVIVGNSFFGSDVRAFIWLEESGMVLLDDYLNSIGISLPAGWYSEQGRSVSGDGLTFAGRARSLTGETMGFVVTIPNPATLLILTSSHIMFGRRRYTS